MCSRFNSELLRARREAAHGVYDIYTNQMHYPRITQPTHARWEQLPDEPDLASLHIADDSTAPTTDGTTPAAHHAARASDTGAADDPPFDATKPGRAALPPLTSFQARNLATVDTHMRFPPRSHLGAPGADGGEYDIGPKGLCEVADDVVAELPEACLGAFLEAREEERRWRMQWAGETEDGLRAEVNVTYTAC